MRPSAAVFLMIQTILWGCGVASGQLTITDPASTNTGSSKGSVRQTSLTTADGVIAARRAASSPTQIRVQIQYLMVDTATRQAIYEEIETGALKNSLDVPAESDQAQLDANQSWPSSSHRIVAPSRVTSCVLDTHATNLAIQKATESVASDVSTAPSVILLDGKEAQTNDVVQHPFVIDVEATGEVVSPKVKSFDDGVRLRLVATLQPADKPTDATIQLSGEIATSRLMEVREDQVFGLGKEPVTVQVPIHQLTTARATEQLSQDQTLLIDPHVSKSKNIERETGVPVLTKIPYLGRSFKSVAVTSVEQHMLVLLKPSVESGKGKR